MSKKHNKVYIYTLSDCRNPEIVKYVGKTQYLTERLKQHQRSAFNRYSKVSLWIKNILLEKSNIVLNVIDEVEENNWQKAEIAYIKLYKSFGANLVNTAIGGNDTSYMRNYKKKGRKNLKQSKLMIGNTIWKNVTQKTRIISAKKANITKSKNKHLYKIKILSENTKEKIKNVLLQNSLNLSKSVVEIDYNFKVINKYNSVSEAERLLNLSGINQVCLNKRCFIKKRLFMFENFTEQDKIDKVNFILSKKRTFNIYNKQLQSDINNYSIKK
jgi:hypothetical protein